MLCINMHVQSPTDSKKTHIDTGTVTIHKFDKIVKFSKRAAQLSNLFEMNFDYHFLQINLRYYGSPFPPM